MVTMGYFYYRHIIHCDNMGKNTFWNFYSNKEMIELNLEIAKIETSDVLAVSRVSMV